MNRKINKVQYKEKDEGVEYNIQVHLRKKLNPEKKISETLSIVESQGILFLIAAFLCGCEEENVNHILIHCMMVRALWDIVIGLVDVKWVFPKTVKEVLTSWRGPFVGKKRKKVWKSILLCIFWTLWKKRNRLAFRGGMLNIQKLKNFFACNLWSWVKLYLGEESLSLISFLEWVAST